MEVFISYRREDSSGHAGWLREGLAERLGRDRVFMDIDTIEPGVDFVVSVVPLGQPPAGGEIELVPFG